MSNIDNVLHIILFNLCIVHIVPLNDISDSNINVLLNFKNAQLIHQARSNKVPLLQGNMQRKPINMIFKIYHRNPKTLITKGKTKNTNIACLNNQMIVRKRNARNGRFEDTNHRIVFHKRIVVNYALND